MREAERAAAIPVLQATADGLDVFANRDAVNPAIVGPAKMAAEAKSGGVQEIAKREKHGPNGFERP